MNVPSTLIASKLAARLSRLSGRGDGQALPGLVAERLNPQLAGELAHQLPHGSILITGTNGKTTTTKLAKAMLESGGERVLSNGTGSNLKRGITSAFIAAADWRGKLSGFTVGLFEVDEASMPAVAEALQPRAIVVLNLFRDQLDRYGELDMTAAVIGKGIAATKAELYLNADDPLVASLSQYAQDQASVYFFGIDGAPVSSLGADTVADSNRCPVCHEPLVYTRVTYSHIGHYKCLKRHFSRPQPSVVVTSVDTRKRSKGTKFTVSLDSKRFEATVPLPGIYNLYNAVAALSLAHGLNLDDHSSVESITTIKPGFGRVETIEYRGRKVCLLLIKNPAGFSQILETFLVGEVGARVLLAINDLAADGRDVSWLWDVPIEVLAKEELKVIVTGIRAYDMALRMRYAEISADVIPDFEAAFDTLIRSTPEGGVAYVLPTYTAMLGIRKLLSNLVQIPEMDA